jgi:hypothetical protein
VRCPSKVKLIGYAGLAPKINQSEPGLGSAEAGLFDFLIFKRKGQEIKRSTVLLGLRVSNSADGRSPGGSCRQVVLKRLGLQLGHRYPQLRGEPPMQVHFGGRISVVSSEKRVIVTRSGDRAAPSANRRAYSMRNR